MLDKETQGLLNHPLATVQLSKPPCSGERESIYVCTHVNTHACTQAHRTHMWTHTCTHKHACAYTQMHTYAHMHTMPLHSPCTYTYILHEHIDMQCMHTHICTHMHTCAYTHKVQKFPSGKMFLKHLKWVCPLYTEAPEAT